MIPPWEKYPMIPRYSMSWRMGDGEIYMQKFIRWYAALSDAAAEDYAKAHPEPAEWEGHCSAIRISAAKRRRWEGRE